jgi:sugar phosphate isomerase/epimerase
MQEKKKMRLGFSINAFAGNKFLPFPEKPLEIIAEAGFENVELVFDKPYFWLKDFEIKRIAEIKTFLKRHNLKVVDVSACTAGGYERLDDDLAPPGQRFGPSFADKDKTRRKLRIEHVKKVIDWAVLLDCPNVNTSTGYQPQDRSFEEAWLDVRDCYREIVRYAQLRNVWINIEYEPGTYGPGGLLIANAKDTMKMIKDVGLNHLGVNLDIGHSFVCKEDIPDVIQMFAGRGRLRHIHLEDMEEKKDGTRVHFHLVPGHGNIDFLPILQTLKKVNYQGCVTLELYSLWDKNPDKACQRSYQYLMSKFGNFFRN